MNRVPRANHYTNCQDCGIYGRIHGIVFFKGRFRCHKCKLKASQNVCPVINSNHKDSQGREELVTGYLFSPRHQISSHLDSFIAKIKKAVGQ